MLYPAKSPSELGFHVRTTSAKIGQGNPTKVIVKMTPTKKLPHDFRHVGASLEILKRESNKRLC